MRITGGRWRSRALEAPRGMATRPTSDRVREALFSMLASDGLSRRGGRALASSISMPGAARWRSRPSRGALRRRCSSSRRGTPSRPSARTRAPSRPSALVRVVAGEGRPRARQARGPVRRSSSSTLPTPTSATATFAGILARRRRARRSRGRPRPRARLGRRATRGPRPRARSEPPARRYDAHALRSRRQIRRLRRDAVAMLCDGRKSRILGGGFSSTRRSAPAPQVPQMASKAPPPSSMRPAAGGPFGRKWEVHRCSRCCSSASSAPSSAGRRARSRRTPVVVVPDAGPPPRPTKNPDDDIPPPPRRSRTPASMRARRPSSVAFAGNAVRREEVRGLDDLRHRDRARVPREAVAPLLRQRARAGSDAPRQDLDRGAHRLERHGVLGRRREQRARVRAERRELRREQLPRSGVPVARRAAAST